MEEINLTISEVAKIAMCHVNTVRNYERKGHIAVFRDQNNFRRYTLKEALKLKDLLSQRTGTQNENLL